MKTRPMKYASRLFAATGFAAILLGTSGCGALGGPELVDLNKVLDVALNTMDQLSAKIQDPAGDLKARHEQLTAKRTSLDPKDTTAVAAYQSELETYKQDLENAKAIRENTTSSAMEQFAMVYTTNLNALPLLSKSQVAVQALSDGSFAGHNDKNGNGSVDTGEPQLFTLEIDAARSRLIATDTENAYRRDGHYRPTGFFTGMLIGSMMNRQASSGINPTRYANMQMSPKNYHSTAKASKARARSSSRSGSFKGGK